MKISSDLNFLEDIISPLKKIDKLFYLSIFGIIFGILNIFGDNILEKKDLLILSNLWFIFSYVYIFFQNQSISIFFKVRFFLISILSFAESLLLTIDPSIHIASLYSWLITDEMRFIFITAGIFASSATIMGWIFPYVLKLNLPKFKLIILFIFTIA